MSLLPKLALRTPRDILLASEALLFLTLFRLCLAILPVRRILGTITHGPAPASSEPAGPAALATALRIRWAVEAVSRNSVARFVCFPQTLAGYLMLRRRGIAGTMVYGVARSPGGDLIAHTWLTLGDHTVLGGDGSEAFSPIDRWT